jgi:hypothetical protein
LHDAAEQIAWVDTYPCLFYGWCGCFVYRVSDKLAQEKKQRIVEKKIAFLIHYFKNNGNVVLLFMNQVLNCSIAVPAVGYSSGPWFQITCLLNSDMLKWFSQMMVKINDFLPV